MPNPTEEELLTELGLCRPDYRLIPAGIHDSRARAFLLAIWQILCLPFERINIYDIDLQDMTVIRQLLNQWNLERFIEPFMTDDDLRELARKGLLLHRLSGTKAGIELALEIADVAGEVKEWFEFAVNANVHTFDVTVWVDENLAKGRDFNDPTIIDNLRRLVTAAKPVRSFFDVIVSKKEELPAIVYTNVTFASAIFHREETIAAVEDYIFMVTQNASVTFAGAHFHDGFDIAN